MKLNLTPAEKNKGVKVSFSVNKFVATFGENDALLGTYASKNALKDEFAENGITNAVLDGVAVEKYLAGYGDAA